MHLFTTESKSGFSKAAATRSLSASCLLMAASEVWLPGVMTTSTLNLRERERDRVHITNDHMSSTSTYYCYDNSCILQILYLQCSGQDVTDFEMHKLLYLWWGLENIVLVSQKVFTTIITISCSCSSFPSPSYSCHFNKTIPSKIFLLFLQLLHSFNECL